MISKELDSVPKYHILCVGVMYSGEYDACDVTLIVYSHRASLKNMPGHGGDRTYDLWNISPIPTYSNRPDRVAKLSWQSIGLVFQRSYVRFPPWSDIFSSLPAVWIYTQSNITSIVLFDGNSEA